MPCSDAGNIAAEDSNGSTQSTDAAGVYDDSPKTGSAKCSALGAISADKDADLAALLEAWPTLPDHDRLATMAIVEAAAGQE